MTRPQRSEPTIARPPRTQRVGHTSTGGAAPMPQDRTQKIAWFFQEINKKLTPAHRKLISAEKKITRSHTLWLILWAVVVGALAAVLYITGTFYQVLDFTTIFFFFFCGLEYLIVILSLKESYPQLPPEAKVGGKPFRLPEGKVALIIPCGYSVAGCNQEQAAKKRDDKAEVVSATLDAALLSFSPSDIFVIHNSNNAALPDSVFAQVCNGRAHYCPLQMGSKSISVYYTAIILQMLSYELCLLIDDDVRLPSNLGAVLSTTPLEGAGYALAIKASHDNPKADAPHTLGQRLLVGLQGAEYALSDLAKAVQSNWSNNASVLAPHGAISLWRCSTLIEVMRRHNALFDGEDYQMGLILRKMGSDPSLQFPLLLTLVTDTAVPERVPDLFHQRKNSWDLAAAQHILGGCCGSGNTALFLHACCCIPCTQANCVLRFFTALDIWTSVQDYMRVVLLFLHIFAAIRSQTINLPVLTLYIVTLSCQYFISLILITVKLGAREDLAFKEKSTTFFTIISFPFYRYLLSFVRVFALLRYIFNYGAIKRNAIPISEMNLPLPDEAKSFGIAPYNVGDDRHSKKLKIISEEDRTRLQDDGLDEVSDDILAKKRLNNSY